MNWTKTPPKNRGNHLALGTGGEKVWAEFNGEYWKLAGIGTATTEELVADEAQFSGPLVPVEEVEKAWYEGWEQRAERTGGLPHRPFQDVDYKHSRARRVVEGEE